MKVITRNKIVFFPNGTTFCQSIELSGYLKRLNSDSVYLICGKDYNGKRVLLVNIENEEDTPTISFNTPVIHLRKF